jgi:hypothetical protein
MTHIQWSACVALLLTACDSPSTPKQPDAAIDAIATDAPVDAPPPRTEAILFLADYGRGVVVRYRVVATTDAPLPDLTFSVPGALAPVIVPASGELLLSHVSAAQLSRVGQPLGTPASTGSVTGFGIGVQQQKVGVVDDEIWVVNPMATNVIRLKFDAAGNPSAGGAPVSATNGRGVVYDPVHRQVFISECCGTNTIKRFALAPNGMVSVLPSITGGLDNPHSMIVTPWSELLVANSNTSTILRYTLDVAGSPTANGMITGNGLSTPIDLVLTPWNELYVVNQTTARISRFTFDPITHAAIPRDHFAVTAAVNIAWLTVY